MLCPWRKRLWVPEEPSLMDRNTNCNAFQCSSQRAALSFQWKLSHMVILHEEPRVKANRLWMKELKHLRINSDKGGFPWLVFSENLEVLVVFCGSPPFFPCHPAPVLAFTLLLLPPDLRVFFPHTDQYSDISRRSYNSFLTLFTWSSCGSYRLRGETQECPNLRQQVQIPDCHLYFWPTGYKLALHDPLLGFDSLLERLRELKEMHLLVYYKKYNNRYRLTVR